MTDTQAHAAPNRFSRALERGLGKRYQQFVFWRSMRRFMRDQAHGSQGFDPRLLSELIHGWGNNRSAQHEYLAACLEHVRDSDGLILECGSGLGTLLAGAVAQSRGKRMYTLEHEPKWAARVQQYLHKYGITSVTVCLAPIRSYGDFDWYSLPSLQTIPNKIALVLCGGPPGNARGGRYGLVPVMLEKLRENCIVLLDDGAREGEKAIAARWAQLVGGNPELMGRDKPFIRLRAGRTANPLVVAPIDGIP